MKNINDITITTDDVQIQITNSKVEASNSQGSPDILTFSLTLDATDYGQFGIVLCSGFTIDDTYLDSGKHLPTHKALKPLEYQEDLQYYAEAIKALYEAEKSGQAPLESSTLYSTKEIMDEQETWGKEDLSKNFDFSKSPFWLMGYPDGCQAIDWDDIPGLIEFQK